MTSTDPPARILPDPPERKPRRGDELQATVARYDRRGHVH